MKHYVFGDTVKGFIDYLRSIWRMKAGLYRMIQFYDVYRDNIIVSPLVAQLSWTNNLLILQGTKAIEEKEFYILFVSKIIIQKEN